MDIELTLLALSAALGIGHIILFSHLQSAQRGYRWTASSREQQIPPLVGIAGRIERALKNYLETFPFFAAAVLIASVAGTHSRLTVWGAQLYFWGRIGYLALYAADFSLARSLFWNIPTLGIILIIAALFFK